MTLQEFPNTQFEPYYFTSPQTIQYNCIAWAFGDSTRWYWPDKTFQKYWPKNIAREVTQAAFISLFMLNNYEICLNGDFEVGFEKIVIYLDSNGTPTHAARQLDNQWWTSKLGGQHDISHSLNALNNGSYGNPSIFMRRPILNLVP